MQEFNKNKSMKASEHVYISNHGKGENKIMIIRFALLKKRHSFSFSKNFER